MAKHTLQIVTHYACRQQIEKHGKDTQCCACTGHECPTVCPICDDTGEIQNPVLDKESMEWVADGNRPCICVINRKIKDHDD